jgi:hypothetical protein
MASSKVTIGGRTYIAGQFWTEGKRIGKPIPSMTTGWGIYVRILGYKNVERMWFRQVAGIRGATKVGLHKAVDYLHDDMINGAYPQEPWGKNRYVKGALVHKAGTLNRAWNVTEAMGSTLINPKLKFGYDMSPEEAGGAPYAWYVHEMTQPPYGDVQWTTVVRSNPGPKWFEVHLRRDKDIMLNIVQQNALKGAEL